MNAGIVRCSMRLPLLIVLLILMSPCDRLWAQTDPFIGTWRWLPEESRFSGPVLDDVKLKFVFENGQLREELRQYLGDKNAQKAGYSKGGSRVSAGILQFDGQEHPYEVTGDAKHRKHTIVWKHIDDHTVEGRINHDDGKEYSTDRFVISPDGRKLTLTLLGQRSDGTQP